MLNLLKVIILAVPILVYSVLTASAYSINGNYASLVSCDFSYNRVRGESGYTGTYLVLGEYWTVYFGMTYCKY